MQSDGMFEAAAARVLRRIGSRGALASLALLALTAIAYWPGHMLLPPVDRTEVIYAESSREMLRDGRLIDPRFAGERERHRPIGTFWLQMASAKVLGAEAQSRISTYRLPSLLGVTLAVLATFWLLSPVTGGVTALLAAGLTAVSPIVAVESQLAITEGIALGLAALAQLALLRLYAARSGEPTRRLAVLLWVALGVSISINALAVPLLGLATLIALAALDRWAPASPGVTPAPTPQGREEAARGWGRRLEPGWGVPLMLVLGAAWPVCLVLAEGGWPYHGLTLREFLGALGGSQAMKFRAPPLSFTLAFVAGSLPFVLLLWPALRRLWRERTRPLERFLLAWIGGYLAYLELISSKPALYTVPVLMPAAAAAVARCLTPRGEGELALPPGCVAWPGWLAVAGWPVLVVALHRLTETALSPSMMAGASVVMLALAVAAWALQTRRAALWAVSGVAGFALFLGFTFGQLLPGLEKGWPTEMIVKAVKPLRACAGGDVLVTGYREPSAVFAFGADSVRIDAPRDAHVPDQARPRGGIVVSEVGAGPMAEGEAPSACVRGVNFTRGCSQSFVVRARDGQGRRCAGAAAFACPPGRLEPVRGLPPCR